MLIGTVCVTLDRYGGQSLIRILLVRDPELMPRRHFGRRDHLPFRAAAEMLGLEGWVAEDGWGGDHGEEV